MIRSLKRILGIRATSCSEQSTEVPLFAESAYFSNRVPKSVIDKWGKRRVTENDQIHAFNSRCSRSRRTNILPVGDRPTSHVFLRDGHPGRMGGSARLKVDYGTHISIESLRQCKRRIYALCSPQVIHAGWIVHCIDEAFRVPIADYVLDDSFVPGPPYKLPRGVSPPLVLSPEPDKSYLPAHGSEEPPTIQASDPPSTPPNVLQKRKRERTYFDSPTGSLIFSEFDRDGNPRRPRKQRRLRFDPSFSPEGGKSANVAKRVSGLELPEASDPFVGDNSVRWRHSSDLDVLARGANVAELPTKPDNISPEGGKSANGAKVSGYELLEFRDVHDPLVNDIGGGWRCSSELARDANVAQSPTKPNDLAHNRLSAGSQLSSTNEPHTEPHPALSGPVHNSLTQIPDTRPEEKSAPVRTIDFTNLPPTTRRFRFPGANTKPREPCMTISTVKSSSKIKAPRQITFAQHAQVRTYQVLPPDTGEDIKPVRQSEEGGTRSSDDPLGDPRRAERVDLPPRFNSSEIERADIHAIALPSAKRHIDTITLDIQQVQTIRKGFLDVSSGSNGAEDSQSSVLFELGKTYRGKEFRHVW
ncbi:hypothetical protein PAXRUDRAFT_652178 [Paxillus rubicundulus Ve08.2h10]|uniref:Unplaced genomic scaffold scaffold_616, whole genome shotgun sequence n=1 Tax=Paxillus rubicundulus Ve08.2h10 TaxID=930991 RepID=A0A0D0D3I3_9AGAM|nr:hypothetical protein PAXRUDRAFT_652178 [Paxillus rubicundulus Ve08.2h10]